LSLPPRVNLRAQPYRDQDQGELDLVFGKSFSACWPRKVSL
jgi:hypothetical protein